VVDPGGARKSPKGQTVVLQQAGELVGEVAACPAGLHLGGSMVG